MSEGTGRLSDRVAIVTGGAHGIGRAYAIRYAEEGAKIAVLDIDEEGANEVAKAIRDAGYEAIAVRVDVSDEASTLGAVDTVVKEFGRVDILMNNAAIFSVVAMSRVPFDELSVKEWDRLMSVNVTGTWLMCRAVAPSMRENNYGKIVNIGSGSLFKSSSSAPVHYNSSKGAVYGLTHALAREFGKFGATVNCLCPGNTRSEEKPEGDASRGTALAAQASKSLGTRAIAREEVPEDLVGAAMFLSSTDSDFITGQTLLVDGGSHFH